GITRGNLHHKKGHSLAVVDNIYRRRTFGDNLIVVDLHQADLEFIVPGLIPGDPEVAGGTIGEGEASGWPEPSFISLEVQFLEYVLPAAGLEVLQVEPVGVPFGNLNSRPYHGAGVIFRNLSRHRELIPQTH